MSFQEKILSILSNIKGTGSYICQGTHDFVFPELEIEGLDELSFPIPKNQINQLIEKSHKAPFGKGSQTILDPTVRSAWEIDADKIKFNNPKWNSFINTILAQTKEDLGIKNNTISANLYKMLIYEEGDFFLPHKDSEKEKGMFGTLIIGLPSKHSGGELLVSFEDKTTSVDFSLTSPNHQLPYCAFYADCTHEIKPLTSGNRVVLVYNLIQEVGKEKLGLEPQNEYVLTLTNLLKEDTNTAEFPKIILLGHQYTEANFSDGGLKGNDKIKAEALLLAAKQAGYYAKMGLVTSYQAGQLEPDGSYYSRRGRRSFYDGYDDEISGTMGEIYDEYIQIKHWANDELPPLKNLKVEENQLIKNFNLNEGEPDEQESEGYTGNAGMEMYYWYHYGAVFLWQKKNHLEVLNNKVDYSNRLDWLEYYTKNWHIIDADEQIIAQDIIDSLTYEDQKYNYKEYNHNAVIDFLIAKNDVEYAKNSGVEMLKKCFLDIENHSFMMLFQRYELNIFEDLFSKNLIANNPKILEKILSILAELIPINSAKTFLENTITKLPSFLEGFDYSSLDKSNAVSIIENCIHLCQKTGDEKLIAETFHLLTNQSNRDYTNEVLVANITNNQLEKHQLSIKLLIFAKKEIQNRVDNKPQPPADWSRAVPISTHYQEVWKLLKEFLESPTEQEFLYKATQKSRTTMENAISNETIDLDTETIKKGSPHILKLTKNQVTYKRELEKWHEDVALLAKTEKILIKN